jgi:hypothetical protein
MPGHDATNLSALAAVIFMAVELQKESKAERQLLLQYAFGAKAEAAEAKKEAQLTKAAVDSTKAVVDSTNKTVENTQKTVGEVKKTVDAIE